MIVTEIDLLLLSKGVLSSIRLRMPIILSRPFFEVLCEMCVTCFILWFVCYIAKRRKKHDETKALVMETVFYEKWCVFWHECSGVSIFGNDCMSSNYCLHPPPRQLNFILIYLPFLWSMFFFYLSGFNSLDAARIFHKLMDRLDFTDYYVQGGDWGAFITCNMSQMNPE